jgi:hypothetical protein
MNKLDLLDLKDKIEAKKVSISRKEGALDLQKKELLEKYKLKPGKPVEKKLTELTSKRELLEKNIEKGLEKLETELEGENE